MLQQILAELAETNTRLVAVSKTKPVEQILDMYHQGQRIFGENRVQELVEKQATLPKDIEWHAIGHLQTNKVKYICSFVSLIHSVDSLKLLREINKQAVRNERVIDCLLQIKIAAEDSKFGLSQADAKTLLGSEAFSQLQNVRIVGLMGMATFTDNIDQVRGEFQHLKTCFEELKTTFFSEQADFKEISMGMSGDYRIAQEEGSTMVRIGSLLFGAR
ncbi:MAG: YggS family pyridoxal phosphate-dependent enzyme [Saprospiraceae bacterium]|nr:YggS family pyridoxal phosphate-dependent enzyme [Saprospiraceae bacterium]